MMRLHVNRVAHVACNFNCRTETEGLYTVTCSHVQGISGNSRKRSNIETLLQITIGHDIRHRTVEIPTTLSDQH